MGPEVIVPVSGIVMILALSLGVPLVRSYTRRMEARPHDVLPSGEVIARLDRIEQAVEAMATEVERIAEGQRFTTKLLSGDNAKSLSAPAPVAAPMSAPPSPVGTTPAGTTLVEAARRS